MNWNSSKILEYCLMTEQDLIGDNLYRHINRGAKVCGIAHVDTVGRYDSPYYTGIHEGSNSVISIHLDDRLGVYTLLDVLSNLIEIDIILTTNEEQMASTLVNFLYENPKVNYNWVFSFDRQGEHAVFYDHDNQAWRDKVSEFFYPDTGSYSDIKHWTRSSAVNLGVGYYNPHRDFCYALEAVWRDQVIKFLKFYAKNKDRKFAYKKRPSTLDNNYYLKYATVAPSTCDFCHTVEAIYRWDLKSKLCDTCYSVLK